MISPGRIRGSFYTLFFIGLNIVYLIIELSFNARILDASAAFSPATDFAHLEIYGRMISASGATIFAWRLFVPGWSSGSLLRLIIKFFLITLIVFPLVFIGQKKLVDNMVDLSSSETRRTAEILNLLKFGVANGFVEIEELAVDDLILQSAEGKMFITLSGVLAYNSSNIRDVLERELDKIASYAIATQQSQHSRQLYKSYLYVSQQIINSYQNYLQLVDELERRQAGSYREAISLYQQAVNEALLPWLKYQQQIKNRTAIEQVDAELVSSIQYLLMTSQQRINTCTNTDCFEENVQQLQLRLAKQLGFFSTVSAWCQQIEQAVPKVNCLKNEQPIQTKILDLRLLTLSVNAGLTRVYSSKLDFLKSIDFRSGVFSWMKQQGIQPDTSWTFTEYPQMLQAISEQLNIKYLKKYDDAVFENYESRIEPRSEIGEFSDIAKMQNYFAQLLGELYREPVPLNLSQTEFDEQFIAPFYLIRFNTLLNKLKADKNWYEAGAPYEQSGKSSLRNLLVPAVAISFSLIFGLLNFINLLLNLLFLLIQERSWLRWFGFSVIGGFILLMPVRHQYKIYSQPAYLELLSETQANYGYWANVLDWVAKTEPVVYPIGNILRYNLLDGFSFD